MLYSSKLKRNDQVEVIAGKDKGRVGKILKVIRGKNRAVVEKINIIKRHSKPSLGNKLGGIIEKEASIHLSNLMLVCPKCTRAVRVNKKIIDGGKTVRACKKCGVTIEPKA